MSELKAKLRSYLAKVHGGRTVAVFDRKTPIARLVPVGDESGRLVVREAIDPEGLPLPGCIKLKERIDVVALLRVDRASR